MKKIIILTSKYLPNPSANGLNTKYIIDEFIERKYDITCISVKDEGETEKNFETIEGVPVYRVNPSFYSKILFEESKLKSYSIRKIYYMFARILRKLKIGLLLLDFPNFDLLQTKRVLNKLENLHKEKNFSCVIAVFQPYSNIAALKKFKKKYPDVVCVGYYLDLITNISKPNFMPKKFYDWLCHRESYKSARLFDQILIPNGGKKTYSNQKYVDVKDKISFVDFPTFVSKDDMTNITYFPNKTKTVLTYAGTLDKKFRNPEILLKVLNELCGKNQNIELNIFGKNNCNEIFNRYNSSLEIILHGNCPHEKVKKAMDESDFLINISNKIQNAVPSKIFELFSTGKPIINIVFDNNDITTTYFEKYPSVYNIKAWKPVPEQIDDIENFLKNEKGKLYDVNQIKNYFLENLPDYTVDIIEKLLPNSKVNRG